MKPNKDFEELFELLNKNKVKYLVVGGYAYAIHAEPRFTKDLDIFIKSDQKNAGKVLKTLQDFGFESLKLKEDDFLESGQIIQLGQPPYRIDILTSISGVEFDKAWKNKIVGNYGLQKVFFIGKKDLIINKKASGRKSDLDDLERLQQRD